MSADAGQDIEAREWQDALNRLDTTGYGDGAAAIDWRLFGAAAAAVSEKVRFRWAEALRSGTWQQCYDSMMSGEKRCAVGVLFEVAGQDGVDAGIPLKMREWAGCPLDADALPLNYLLTAVMRLNDERKMPFGEIAGLIHGAAG